MEKEPWNLQREGQLPPCKPDEGKCDESLEPVLGENTQISSHDAEYDDTDEADTDDANDDKDSHLQQPALSRLNVLNWELALQRKKLQKQSESPCNVQGGKLQKQSESEIAMILFHIKVLHLIWQKLK